MEKIIMSVTQAAAKKLLISRKTSLEITKILHDVLENLDSEKYSEIEFISCSFSNLVKNIGSSQNDATSVFNNYESVSFFDCTFDNDFKHFEFIESKSIKRLKISQCHLNAESISYMNCCNMVELDLSKNGIESIDFLMESKLESLLILKINDNRIPFDKGSLKGFLTQFSNLKELSIAHNIFNGFDHFDFVINTIGDQLRTLDNYAITQERIEETKNKYNERIQQKKKDALDQPNDFDWHQEKLVKFSGLTEKVNECLKDPAQSVQSLKQLNDRVEHLVRLSQNNQNASLFLEKQDDLKDQVDRFIIQIRKLLETQKSTHSLVIRILVTMAQLKQSVGTMCFRALNNYCRQYRESISSTISRHIIPKLRKNTLKQLYNEGYGKLLHDLVELIEQNQVFDIIDANLIECMDHWMDELHDQNFDHERYLDEEITLAALRLIKCSFQVISLVSLTSQYITNETRRTDKQYYLKYFLEQHLILNFKYVKNKVSNSKRGYYLWLNFFAQSIGIICQKRSESAQDGINRFEQYYNLKVYVFNNEDFRKEMIDLLDTLVYELFSTDSLNNDLDAMSPEKKRLFASILDTFSTIFDPECTSIIDLGSPQFSQKKSAGQESIFMAIFKLSFMEGRQKDKLDLETKSSIFHFVASCLENKKIVYSANEDDPPSHLTLVRILTEILNNCKGLLRALDLSENYSEEEIAYVITACNIIKYYSYNAEIHSNLEKASTVKSNVNFTSKSTIQQPSEDREIQKICDIVSKELDEQERDRKLFNCLEIDNDDLRLAIVDILNSLPISQYNNVDVQALWSKVDNQQNVRTGKIELILGTIYIILSKIVADQSTELGANFVKTNGKQCLNKTLELLRKNMERDLRNDPEEQEEKDQLTCCAILFLKYLMRIQDMYMTVEPPHLLSSALEILQFEYDFNPRSAVDCDIERAVSVDNPKHLVEFTKKIPSNSYNFFRIINHIGNLLEGHQYKYSLEDIGKKWLTKDVVEYCRHEKEQMIYDELSIFMQEELKKGSHHSSVDQDDAPASINDSFVSEGQMKENEFFYWVNQEIMPVIHSEKLLEFILDSICNQKMNQDDRTFIESELSEESYSKLIQNYEEIKHKLKTRINKSKEIGQEFLIKKLRSRKEETVKLEQHAKRERFKVLMKGSTPPQPESDIFKYYLSPLIPIKSEFKADFDSPTVTLSYLEEESLPESIYRDRLFTLNVCAFLRILYNMMVQNPNPTNSALNSMFLRSSKNLNQIMYVCERAGWGTGYIASKFLRIISLSLSSSDQEDFKLEQDRIPEEDEVPKFSKEIGVYHLRFVALGKIVNFFQQKFLTIKIDHFTEEELEILEETSRNCFQTMRRVKEMILFECDERSYNANSQPKNFYDIHSDSDRTMGKELAKWVLGNYMTERFIKIFISAFVRMYKPIVDSMENNSDPYSHRNISNFRRTMHTSSCISDFISLYISIFPSKRFKVIRYFMETELKLGIKIRSQIIASLIEESYIATKMERLADFMNTKEAGIGTFAYADESIKIAVQAFMIKDRQGRCDPVFLIITNHFLYVFLETLEKPCQLCRADSLCPEPPKCILKVHLRDYVEKVINVEDSVNYYFDELPDTSTLRIRTPEDDLYYFDMKTNDRLIYFEESLSSFLRLDILGNHEEMLKKKTLFGVEYISMSSVLILLPTDTKPDYKLIYATRGKRIIVLKDEYFELLIQDVDAYSKFLDTILASDTLNDTLRSRTYPPDSEKIRYSEITKIAFSNSHLALATLTIGAKTLSLLFPSDYEREKFKWSLCTDAVSKSLTFEKTTIHTPIN